MTLNEVGIALLVARFVAVETMIYGIAPEAPWYTYLAAAVFALLTQ